MIEKVIEAFKEFNEVDAMLLGGSRATGIFDDKSDYDVYVYLNKPLHESKRKEVLKNLCSSMEYSNHFWELEDDGTLNNGIEIELIYRKADFFESIIKNMKEMNVGNGYSTCFYDNLVNSIILFDKSGKISDLQSKNKGLISDEFVQTIIDANFPLIYESTPALYWQVQKAMGRQDYNSVNHRLSEYFAIYYDILFGLNKTSHPGEKKLIKIATSLEFIPKNFRDKVHKVFFNSYENSELSLKNLYLLSKDIEKLIIDLGYKI